MNSYFGNLIQEHGRPPALLLPWVAVYKHRRGGRSQSTLMRQYLARQCQVYTRTGEEGGVRTLMRQYLARQCQLCHESPFTVHGRKLWTCFNRREWYCIKWRIYEPPHDKTNKRTYAFSKDSDQPGHSPSLI